MEVYSTFQIKDHYYWTPEAPKQQPQAPKVEAAKPSEKPRYKSWKVREADGSVTYYDAQVNKKPAPRMGGIMI